MNRDKFSEIGRGIVLIWIPGENIPQQKDIPDCPSRAKRLVEFQAVSQQLGYLEADILGTRVGEATGLASPVLKAIDWALATQSNSYEARCNRHTLK